MPVQENHIMKNIITTTLAVCVIAHLASAGSAGEGLSPCEAPGGIIVYMGKPDLETLKELYAEGQFTVQVLHRDSKVVENIRENVSAAGLYGPVSARVLLGERLPQANNLVNMVIAEDMMGLSEEELVRVVCPLGHVRIRSGNKWKTISKPWPDDIDEWTHFLHDASCNPLAEDERIGIPRQLQWFSSPRWCRSHEFNSSFPVMVSARGRIFYVFDQGVTGMEDEILPEKWTLFARDGFNGKLLWKRPLPKWGTTYWQDRSLRYFFKQSIARRLVAIGDRIYFTVDIGGPIHVIDALTGKTLRLIEGTEGVREILISDNNLFCSFTTMKDDQSPGLKIVNYDLKHDKILWVVEDGPGGSMLVGLGEVLYSNSVDRTIVCRNRSDGSLRWRFDSTGGVKRTPVKGGRKAKKDATAGLGYGRVETMIVAEDKFVMLGSEKLVVVSIENGEKLWDAPREKVHGRGVSDVFYTDGKLWCLAANSLLGGYDLETGEQVVATDISSTQSYGHHRRCYRSKATSNYVINQYRGAEFLSMHDEIHSQNDWLRGACTYGVMPANGFLYAPPNPCFCYPGAMFKGLKAIARETGDIWVHSGGQPAHGPLEKGPAFSTSHLSKLSPDSWLSYRSDARRTGSTKTRLPESLDRSWEKSFDTKVTQPVVADGRLYVAVKDRHQVVALESASGKALWTFTSDARIDSSPSIYGRVILFGCADGYLYCVRNEDGVLVWRRRMAPADRWIASEGQLESTWRLHGSVLIERGLAYTCAGRSSFLDGGLFLAAVDIATGNVVHEGRLDTRMNTREDREKNHFVPAFHIEGANSDILTAEGGFIYLNQMKFTADLQKVPPRYLSEEEITSRPSINLDNKPYVNEDIFKVEWQGTRSTYEKLATLMSRTKEG